MSHGDRINISSESEFEVLATTDNCPFAAIRHKKYPFYGVQFHPEVHHTDFGSDILRNFIYNICGCKGLWLMKDYVKEAIDYVKTTVGDTSKVLCAISGGVDSTVTAMIVASAIGSDRTICVFVDNGLLRKSEPEMVKEIFKHTIKNCKLLCLDAHDVFISRLKGVTDPETKRQIIGNVFIDIFKDVASKFDNVDFLAQGTLYPDVIESKSAFGGPSAKIKTHHNVGGLPEYIGIKLIEPLKFLFKDEVRRLGYELGLPETIINRQPFPGPGLAVRVIGEVTNERLNILREADEIVTKEIESRKDIRQKLWQYFAILLPISTVGVMGDQRTYEHVIALRIVESKDAMTADWSKLPDDMLSVISSRIVNEVRGVNRVVYDITSKPPGTIEWE
jgi:GMP synthase (glutamine-hydrolysing)